MKSGGLATAVLAGTMLAGWAENGYRFTLDGEEISPRVVPVFGEEGEPAAGDVIRISRFPMVLGGPGEYAFRGVDESQLLGKLPGMEVEACVAVRVDEDADGKLIDPLSPMTAEQKALLRGVVMDARPADVKKAFEGIDWDNTMLSLSYRFAGGHDECTVLPWLPDETCYLEFDLRRFPSVRDVSTIRPLKDLVYLTLDSGVELKLSELRCGSRIRHFNAGASEPKQLDAIASWKSLRTLDLSLCEGLENLDAVKGLPHLRRLWLSRCENLHDVAAVAWLPRLEELDIGMTPVEDLSPVGKLKKLKFVDANFSSVKVLPREPEMPALRALKLMSTEVTREDVERLRAALPECEVLDSWHGSLLAAVKGADRLRVRSGGTCHRDRESEETLFEVKEAAVLREFIGGLTIDEKNSGFHCMCCGEPTLEFYQGDKLVVMLGFHHGQSLRWAGGSWPGDCMLTDEAADRLCAFMAEHGHDGPLLEREASKRREAAYARYQEACREYLSDEEIEGWLKLKEEGEDARIMQMVEEKWPEPDERAERVLTLYGLRVWDEWSHCSGLDEILDDHLLDDDPLDMISAKRMQALLRRNDCPEEVMQGVSRRLFRGPKGFELLKALPDPLLEKIVGWALRHPRASNRGEVLDSLAAAGQERMNEMIFEFLREPPELRKLPAGEEAEPEGNQVLVPLSMASGGLTVASDRGLAALLLAQRGFRKALPVIERLAEEGPEEDRKIYRKAIELMGGN